MVGADTTNRDGDSALEHIRASRAEIAADFTGQGFDLRAEACLVPIFANRYVVCMPDLNSSVVLSLVVNATDAIVYGSSRKEYLDFGHPDARRNSGTGAPNLTLDFGSVSGAGGVDLSAITT
jgi:hypothetical protein